MQVVTGDSVSQDEHTYAEPMCGAVLSEVATYDTNSKDVLIVRVSSAGLESSVEVPKKIASYTVQIPVSRTNPKDFVHQLLPTASDNKRDLVKQDASERLLAHFDYEVFNNALNAMVPEQESWTVKVTLNPPFLFGNMMDTMFKAPPN